MSHASDPKVRRSLNQAQGHLASILTMLTDGRSCLDLAQQLQAVESTIRTVKRALMLPSGRLSWIYTSRGTVSRCCAPRQAHQLPLASRIGLGWLVLGRVVNERSGARRCAADRE